MFARLLPSVTVALIVLNASWPAAAADPGAYREFRLGTSTADVIARAGAAERDIRTLHERPALLQELSWRPPYRIGVAATDRDPVADIVFSFIDNQLFKMVVDYDRSRTEGLTRDDMIASLSAVYGPRSTSPAPATRRTDTESIDAPTMVARWRHGDTTITLQESAYSGGFGLVIGSVSLEALARKAQTAAVTMEARDAPAREAARVKAEAEAAKAAAEKTRATNKAAFKP